MLLLYGYKHCLKPYYSTIIIVNMYVVSIRLVLENNYKFQTRFSTFLEIFLIKKKTLTCVKEFYFKLQIMFVYCKFEVNFEHIKYIIKVTPNLRFIYL